MNKVKTIEEIKKHIKDGMTIMFGGFLCCGQALTIIDMMIKENIKDITLICNDTGYEDKGVGKLVTQGRVKKVITSHIGLNPNAGKFMNEGKMEVSLVPQGTLAERIRAGGAGLGGILTPTGVGTTVEEGKQIITLDGKNYLLERPLRADLAIIKASKADKSGNLQYFGTTKNFNPIMAMAADLVIAQANEIVEVGGIDPSFVHTPNVVVDYILGGEQND